MEKLDMNKYSDFDIAIIGMDCQLPGIKDINEFWKAIVEGEEKITFYTDEELREKGVPEEYLTNPSYVKAGTYLEDATCFDYKFFNYLPREAQLIDPQQIKFLECSWKAMEDAGYCTDKYNGRIGVYGGCNMNSYFLANVLEGSSLGEVINKYGDQQLMIGNDKDYITSRVSFKLNLKGPSINVQAACATSLYAIHIACQHINNGECDMAIAGGSSVRFPHKVGYFYKEGGTFSNDGHIYSFDSRAHGSMSGYGAGAVVLKPLKKAVEDKNQIYAVIKGSAITNDGGDKSSFTAPNVFQQAKTFNEAIQMSDVPIESISYIEAHGAGTIIGDPIEIESFKTAFKMSRNKEKINHNCVIGTVKPNVGHMDAAAGVAGVIKTALCLKNKTLPPLVNFMQPNKNIDLDDTNFTFITQAKDWDIPGYPLRASVNGLGMGGHNANIIFEEPPVIKEESQDKGYKIINLSARNLESLKIAKENLYQFVHNHKDINLKSIEYTLQLGRKDFEYRTSILCKNSTELLEMLSNSEEELQKVNIKDKKIAFLLSADDDKLLDIAHEIYKSSKLFKESIHQFDSLLDNQVKGVLEEIVSGKYKQVVNQEIFIKYKVVILFVLNYALVEYLKSIQVNPDIMIGCGLGELVTACIAKSVGLDDAIYYIYKMIRQEEGHIPFDNTNHEIPWFSSKNGEIYTGEELIKSILGNDITENEEFLKTYIKKIEGEREDYLFIELGVKEYFKKYFGDSIDNSSSRKVNYEGLFTPYDSSRNKADKVLRESISKLWMAGVGIDWQEYHANQVYPRISLPTYPFIKTNMEFTNKSKKETIKLEEHKKDNNNTDTTVEDNLSNVKEIILDLINDIVGCKVDDLEVDIDDLGMTSLQMVQFATRINWLFRTSYTPSRIEHAGAVKDIIDLIKR